VQLGISAMLRQYACILSVLVSMVLLTSSVSIRQIRLQSTTREKDNLELAPSTSRFCLDILGETKEKVHIIMVADSGNFTGHPENVHYISNLRNWTRKHSPACEDFVVGRYTSVLVCKPSLSLSSKSCLMVFIDV